jgi:predicted nucleic acid-binding protein
VILADTDILSAFAKIGQVELLFALFKTDTLYVVPAVVDEIDYSYRHGRVYAQAIVAYLESQRLQVAYLTEAEQHFAMTLAVTLGAGERESMAVAYKRGWVLLCNESRVAHFCQEYQVALIDLTTLLRSLWREKVIEQSDVQTIITELSQKDRMGFNAKILNAIFQPEE